VAHRDPYQVLGIDRSASAATIKAAWRRLAREHHPDLAADETERDVATRRMAEINAAYEELRAPVRRPAGAARGGGAAAYPHGADGSAPGTSGGAPGPERPAGPPPDPPARPVKARFDATPLFRARNATTTPEGGGFRHHPRPRVHLESARARIADRESRRASAPNGPLERRLPHRPPRHERPSLPAARATEICFGKFSGWTLGTIAVVEPAYLDWIVRTVTRDPDLVSAVRVVLAAMGRSIGE
jgi:curved DNA-binding protein CbpA